jgi:flagellar biosynthesis protein FliQ
MNGEIFQDLVMQGARVLLLVLLPVLLGAGISGLCIGAFQAVTSIRDQALSYVVKVFCLCILAYILLPVWVEAFQELALFAWGGG